MNRVTRWFLKRTLRKVLTCHSTWYVESWLQDFFLLWDAEFGRRYFEDNTPTRKQFILEVLDKTYGVQDGCRMRPVGGQQ